MGLQEEKTTEKQLPFDEKKMKECTKVTRNILGNSGEVGLQAGTNSIENDKETTELLPSEWINGTTMGHKEQN